MSLHRVVFVVLFVGLVGLPTSAQDKKEANPKFEPTAQELDLLAMTNAERKKMDVAPLKLSPSLTLVARAHSENMAKQGKMEHELDGKTPFDRIKSTGYQYWTAGENIAYSLNLPMSETMKGWMNSEGHRANILNAKYTEIGLGIGRNSKGENYFTQVFGLPRE